MVACWSPKLVNVLCCMEGDFVDVNLKIVRGFSPLDYPAEPNEIIKVFPRRIRCSDGGGGRLWGWS